MAAQPYPTRFPRPGWAEQAPDEWLAALGPVIARALEAADLDSSSVRALGIAGQLDGCIGIAADGRPVAPCLIWMDRRAEREAAAFDAAELRRRTGITRDPTHLAAKALWLKRNPPEGARPVRFHQPVSYLVERLTGEAVLDHALASTTMLYDLTRQAFDPELLQAFELRAEELPAIAPAAERAGPLTSAGAAMTGLPAGIAVAVGTGDDFAAPLGAGLAEPGRVACVLGTAEVVGALAETPVIDSLGLVETHRYPAGGFYIQNPGWLSGGAVAWLRDLLGLDDFATFDRLAVEAPPASDGLLFLPALSGAMAPEWIASARGCFYGLTPAHGRSHLARAVLEGCAYAMRDVIERLRALGVAAESLLPLGGGARSELWAGIRADLTGLPAEIPALRDTAALGAAMCAAVAAGVQPSLPACAKLVGGRAGWREPAPERRGIYDAAYHRYRRLFEALRPMFDERPAEAPHV